MVVVSIVFRVECSGSSIGQNRSDQLVWCLALSLYRKGVYVLANPLSARKKSAAMSDLGYVIINLQLTWCSTQQ
jgi:hypothetical protein